MMVRAIIFLLLLCFDNAVAKTTRLRMLVSGNLVSPTCSLTMPPVFDFGNINGNDFLNGDVSLRTRTIDIYASCSYISRVDLMLIPQHGTVSGINNSALTDNSSVIYSVSLIDLGANDVSFDTNILWPSPGTTSLRMRLAPNGTLTQGAFNTSMKIQLTYI